MDLDRLESLMAHREGEAEILLEEQRQHALTSRSGTAELISCAIDHLEVKYKEGSCENSNLPREDIEYPFIILLETVAKGSFGCKQPGQDVTNGKGMTALNNFDKVTSGMMGLYNEGSDEYVRLQRGAPKWERLVKTLYGVHCYLKSQQK